MGRKYLWAIVCCCLLFCAGCTDRKEDSKTEQGRKEDVQEEDEKTELTIWLDEDNAMDIRYRIRNFGSDRDDITWKLVHKGRMTPEQYKDELMEAIQKGDGPDFIYMDACNGLDPAELMESGMLAGLGDVSTFQGTPLNYMAGALEAGMRDGSSYVVPLSMKCPVVFGYADVLEAAGIQTDGMYGSLEQFLDAVIAAAQRTGKYAFEDGGIADWLQQYYLPKDPTLAEKLGAKLEELRDVCPEADADKEGKFRAYRMLQSGECLLGGCGVYDHKQLGLAVSLLEGDGKVSFLSIPDSNGGFTGLVTQAVGVSASSAYPEEAKKALQLFQESSMLQQDLNVIDDDRNSQILQAVSAALLEPQGLLYAVDGRSIVSSNAQKEFLEHSVRAVTDTVYMQDYEDQNAAEGETQPGEWVAAICYPDHGGDWPVAEWLTDAAQRYKGKSGTQLQLLPVSKAASVTAILYKEMDQYGSAPDAVLYRGSYVDMTSPLTEREDNKGTDLTEMLETSGQELAFLPEPSRNGIQYAGGTVGLPLQAREYGIWLNHRVLADMGISEDQIPEGKEELTELLQRLSQETGACAMMDKDADTLHAMAIFLEGEELLTQQEDGSWQCDAAGWEAFLAAVRAWKDDAVVAPLEEGTYGQAMQELAAGSVGAVIGSSSLAGWIDGSYGAGLEKGQREDVFFVPLSPAAGVDLIFVSRNSDHAQDIFDFWKYLLQEDGYADAVKSSSCIPVTELSATVQFFLPCQQADASTDQLWDALWESDTPVEELAEKYPWLQ